MKGRGRCGPQALCFWLSRAVLLVVLVTLVWGSLSRSRPTFTVCGPAGTDCPPPAQDDQDLPDINVTKILQLATWVSNPEDCRGCIPALADIDLSKRRKNFLSLSNNNNPSVFWNEHDATLSRLLRNLYIQKNTPKPHDDSGSGSGFYTLTDDEDYSNQEYSGSGFQETPHRTENVRWPDKWRSGKSQGTRPVLDTCAKWLSCQDHYLQQYLRGLDSLPSCPCVYPFHKNELGRVWDQQRRQFFYWRDSSDSKYNIKVYKPGASHCVFSKIVPRSTTLSAQQCCYDKNNKLITRGKSAGTPNLISPDISKQLHHKVDVLPWIICKGDWTRYNAVRPPNNVQNCPPNPSNKQFIREIIDAKDY